MESEKNLAYWNGLAVKAVQDEIAFTELYEHFFPRVYKFIYAKTSDPEITDEIMSKTFTKMFENLSRYNPNVAAFSTWLFQIALNEMKTLWRKNNYRGEHEESWDENFNPTAPEYDEPEKKILQSEINEKIRAALEKLPERERRIIEMTYWLNYPPRKIAEILDLRPNTVSVILKRAKESLKKILS